MAQLDRAHFGWREPDALLMPMSADGLAAFQPKPALPRAPSRATLFEKTVTSTSLALES
jgi:hypothetical protein